MGIEAVSCVAWITLLALASGAQDVTRVQSALPMPTGSSPLALPCASDGRVELATLVRDFAAHGGWSLALDSETEFALGRAGVHVFGELTAPPESAQLVVEALLEAAGFALDAVWDERVRSLGVALRETPTLVPRALEMDELEAWSTHPAFEVELAFEPDGLHRQFLAMLLRRWLGEHGAVVVERRPSERLVLRGGARTIANAGGLVRAMQRLARGELSEAPFAGPTSRTASALLLVPDAPLSTTIGEAALATRRTFVCTWSTAWELAARRSHWKSALELAPEDVAVVFEEWLADHGVALVELSPRVARLELLSTPLDAAVLARASFMPGDALGLVSDRAATWYATAFRFEHLDERAIARELTRHVEGASPIVVRSLDSSNLLLAAGPGRDLAELASVLGSLERAAAAR